MQITSLDLADFRNYEHYALRHLGGLTLFTGRNGAGKTNILESIGLLTAGISFRHAKISQMVREGASLARVAMQVTDGNRLISTAVALSEGSKRFSVNGKSKTVQDVRGTLPSVSFTPDDLQLAKKTSSVKRDALDGLGVQLSKSYDVVHRDFLKTLRYKNRLLKEEAAQSLIEALDETFITCGAQLTCYRRALYAKMMPLVAEHYSSISRTDEPFQARYVYSWDRLSGSVSDQTTLSSVPESEELTRDEAREALATAIRGNMADERARRRALAGPHNDMVLFFLSGKDTSSFASQGQQRSIVLAWKLAEVDMVHAIAGVQPVLLLDDVMSELDAHRRQLLVENVGQGLQTFITATDTSPFSPALLERGTVINLG